jgi:hypothetical protein
MGPDQAVRLLCLLTVAASCARPVRPPDLPISAGEDRMAAIFTALDQMIGTPLWPGFDPRVTPVALHDGVDTWLFRHPRPPGEFRPVRPGLAVVAGRHPAVRASTAVELGGVLTATVELATATEPRRVAAMVVHETFHVFAWRQHPDWSANELDALEYPDTDSGAAELRYLEDASLQQAIAAHAAGDLDACRCAAEAALAVRNRRADSLPGPAMSYERAIERFEGLAQYVEYLASGSAPPWPVSELAPDQVRRRAHHSGHAWAVLLDAYSPGWQARFDRLRPPPALDGLFREALLPGPACPLTAKQSREVRRQARHDVEVLRDRRRVRTRELDARPGSRLVVEAGGEPLWPHGFDPVNIERLSSGRLAHPQWLKLGNETGSIEVLEHPSLTEGSGPHPLRRGIRRLVVPGLGARPTVTREGDVVVINAVGVRGRLRAASVTEEKRGILVKLR